MIRAFSSAFEATRIPLRMVLVILTKKTSTGLSSLDLASASRTHLARMGLRPIKPTMTYS